MSSRSHGSRKTARRPTHNVTNPTVVLRKKQKARVAAVLAQIKAVQERETILRRQREALERELARIAFEEEHLFNVGHYGELENSGIKEYLNSLEEGPNVTEANLFSW